MRFPIVTLTTDFGLKDSYVAEMKAIILGISPKVRIVDVTHQIEKFNVTLAAYVLASASPYFPERTVHVVVVDPGVGTKRQPILVQTKKSCFVGPDNGVLALAAKNISGSMHIHRITNRELMLSRVSNTFHGRDIFAPAAAHLANGRSPAEFGPEIRQMVLPGFARIVRKKDALEGQVIYIDDFGNVITNFTEKELEATETEGKLNVEVENTELALKLCKAYGNVGKQQPLAIIGSHNFLEISVNLGSAANVFNMRVGDKVLIYRS